MNATLLQYQAQIQASIARVEGMKAANLFSVSNMGYPQYAEGHFQEEAEHLEELANLIRDYQNA